jgi:two-component system LytT family response regulator
MPRTLGPLPDAAPMARLRILIVDDEPLARERVQRFLSNKPNVLATVEAGSGAEALAEIRRDPPDIAILDIQMPGCTGLDLLRDMPSESRPAVIIATAHHEYAVDAFAEQVVDYLVKPFDGARFDLALKRAEAFVDSRRRAIPAGLAEGADSESRRGPIRSLAARVDGRVVFMRPDEILWIEAQNNYCLVHFANARPLLIRETMGSLEARLGASGFVRVSRSALVNVEEVRELLPARFGDYTVVLRSGINLPLSRKMRGGLLEVMSSRE